VPFRPAGTAVSQLLGTLESRWGPIPLTVSSWMRIVGDVWLVGTHPDWIESDEADPLVIELEGSRYAGQSMVDSWANEYAVWVDMSAEDPDLGGFVMPVAPDRLTKANVCGGAPYGFRLPDSRADALFVAEQVSPFVSYLNHVFANGGFPARTGGEHQANIKRSLSEGLHLLESNFSSCAALR
jgi:hypothetical protein